MAKAVSKILNRNRRLVPIRIEKHFRRLELYSARESARIKLESEGRSIALGLASLSARPVSRSRAVPFAFFRSSLDLITLESKNARVQIDEEVGGRLASLEVHGLELLVRESDSQVAESEDRALAWGCYPMAPWASRIRNGEFEMDGVRHTLPLRMPPHAIHGTVLDRVWAVESVDESHCTLSIDLGPDWPWAGEVRQRVEIQDQSLLCHLEIRTESTYFPFSMGWHPWFRRQLARGEAAELQFSARQIYLRDADDIPTGDTAAPGDGPYDDTFTGVEGEPRIHWPNALTITLASDLDHWVVYDALPHALCVEPLSGPPDALNIAPQFVELQKPARGEFRISWSG